jgi:thymidylate synthase (FAD)
VAFIRPCFFPEIAAGDFDHDDIDYSASNPLTEAGRVWLVAMLDAEQAYIRLIDGGCPPQEARSVLPNSLKTELIMTANLREWRHFFRLRAAGQAGRPHPQMLEITAPMLMEFRKLIPVVFDDIIPLQMA